MKKRWSTRTHYHLMVAPGLLWLFFFSLVPMVGIVMAFQDFNPSKGYWGSEWVGLENFAYLFSMGDSWQVIRNTLIIASPKWC